MFTLQVSKHCLKKIDVFNILIALPSYGIRRVTRIFPWQDKIFQTKGHTVEVKQLKIIELTQSS